MKIAMVAPYPAQMVLKPEQIKPSYLNRSSHAAPWVRSLTTALVKRGDVEFRVFTHSRAVSSVQRGEENGVQFTVIPQYESARFGCWHLHLPARIQFRKYIKEYAPDLIHGFGTESAYGLIASEQKIPGIVFIQGIQAELAKYHDHLPALQKMIRQKLEQKVISRASGVIAETGFAQRWALGMKESMRVAVIPHAVNAEFFNVKPTYSANECLCIGTLNRTKAVDTSIRALAKACNQSLTLSVIGHGGLLNELMGLAKELGVAARVQFLGHMTRGQIMEKMATARMLTILSRMDTSPNILTEAHAAGVPVIGTRAGGIPDMIEDGKDGFLVDVDDFRAVAENMDSLAADAELCRRLGAAGRAKVKWMNDPDRVADLHMKFYREMLDI